MCGTANHNNNTDYEHLNKRMGAADTAAYEHLAKETKKPTHPHQIMTTVKPSEQKKSSDTLTVITAATKTTADKFALFFEKVQKSPAYK